MCRAVQDLNVDAEVVGPLQGLAGLAKTYRSFDDDQVFPRKSCGTGKRNYQI
jgi:hypothetical protein